MLLSPMDELDNLPSVPWEQLMAECEVVGEMLRNAREHGMLEEVIRTYRLLREQGVDILLACASIHETYFTRSDKPDDDDLEPVG